MPSNSVQTMVSVLWLLSVVGTSHALVSRSSARSVFGITSKQKSRRCTLTMYFDDVSRHPSQPWHPKGNELANIANKQPLTNKPSPYRASDEKLDAVKRLILGYDSESAALLSDQEVVEQMQLWADKSGVVGESLGDELYEKILGMTVCRSSNLVGCIAQFWSYIVDVIKQNSDEFNPVDRWVITKSDRPQVFMMVFPNCKELYDYKTMTTLNTAMEFSKELCLHLGQRFKLTLFHPKYKNSPKMWSPARHSPFPCSGLHFEGEEDEEIDRMLKSCKPRRGYVTNDRGSSDDDSVPNLKERRVHLEILFNSAAASSTVDDLNRDPVSRNMSQRLPKEVVVEMSQLWIDSNRFTSSEGSQSKREVNRALQFADTVDGRWTVTESKIAEEVYAEIWGLIRDLYEQGLVADMQAEPQDEHKATVARKFDQIEWMRSLGRPFQQKGENGLPPIQVLSAMLVSTKFCAFNAQSFKRFAITVNAALKRFTNGQMFLEVFHPEYVGNKGYNSELRRSPFPTIQVCYEIRKKQAPVQVDQVSVEKKEKE